MGDLPDLLGPGDLLVFNDIRVIPARLVGRRGEATVEVTLHQPVGAAEASAGLAGAVRASEINRLRPKFGRSPDWTCPSRIRS